MTREQIEAEIVTIIESEKTIPPGALTSTALLSEAGIDSLDALNILFALEERFKISIPDDKARAIRTLDDMTSTIAELLPS